jgi:hypothetical protein
VLFKKFVKKLFFQNVIHDYLCFEFILRKNAEIKRRILRIQYLGYFSEFTHQLLNPKKIKAYAYVSAKIFPQKCILLP